MCARGIDVSDFQDPVNWQAVAQDGISFAFTKATEGATFVADCFDRNWAAMKRVGILRGAYHFYRTKKDPQVQADLFLRTVKFEQGDLPPVLDIESTDGMDSGTIIAGMTQWLTIVEKQTGIRPIIYTYPSFWQRIGNPQRFADYPLWIAHYETDAPLVPGGWDGWTFWQYTQEGSVYGVDGDVDVNYFNTALEGDRGSHIEYIQKRLKDKGFNPGSINGMFSASTRAAVATFQKAMGLRDDGILGINTWAAAVSKARPPVPNNGGGTSPPVNPGPAPAIRLIDVWNYYRGVSHQDQALQWLQGQVSQSTLQEFARRWRNQSVSQVQSIRLIDACKSYKNLSYQDQALQWLQGQILPASLEEFARQWRSNKAVSQSTSIRLLDVCKYYQGLPKQEGALDWLQGQLSSSILQEFSRQWRGNAATQLTNIRLIDVCKYYRGLPNQDRALEWLQGQIPQASLDEFARRWRG